MSLCNFISLIIALLPAVLTDCPDSSLGPRSRYDPATAHKLVPWHAILYSQGQDSWVATCGATLVSPTHLVTAANCFLSENNSSLINPALFEVVVGKQCEDHETLEEDMQMFRVKQVTLHPWFRGSATNYQHDIAVVELKKAVNITAAVSLAIIDRSESVELDLPAGGSGTVAVWERTEYRSLSSVRLPYLDVHTCADMVHARHGLVPSLDKFCAGSENVNRSMCRQDNGVGFVYQHPVTNLTFLRGVLSTNFRSADSTENCYQNDVAAFTNIAERTTLQWLTQLVPAPPGYEQLSGLVNRYKYHGITLSWQDAKTSCEAEGTHLVILNSEAEFSAMKDLIEKNKHKEVGSTYPGCAWVGVKESDTKQNEFYTVLGQLLSATGFSRWRPGQPDTPTLGDGVYIKPIFSGLGDAPATSSYRFAYICELEVW